MSEIGEVLENKFSEAYQMMNYDGENAVHADMSLLGQMNEIIGLDCEIRQPNRYIVSKSGIDDSPPTFEFKDVGMVISSNYWLVKIPRKLGDNRSFEDLPEEAFQGSLFMIDVNRDLVVPVIPCDDTAEKLCTRALSRELESLRVAKTIPVSNSY